MTRTFALPDLGEGLTEAEIVTWLVAEGDVVVVDQAVAEVETAKSVVEVPTPYAGVVERLCAGEGETLEVGLPLLEVGEPIPQPAAGPPSDDGGRPAGSGTTTAVAGEQADPAEPTAAGDETYREEERAGSGNVLVGYGTRGGAPEEAGPRRRRRPRDPDRLADVSGAGAPRTGGESRIPMTGFQKAAATAMSRSRAEIPEATIWVDVDFTALTELRAARPDGPGILAYLARFVTAALAEHPVLNARVDAGRDEIVQLDRVNLGLAVQGSRGLVAPAVLGAERMTTARLDAAIRDLVARTREGGATNEELTAGTFTLNNYGGLGVDGSAPIINHPQVAMLGVGRIIDRPWVVDGLVEPRKIAQVSFVFDHRVCDGVEAAAFLRAVTTAVEDPLSVIERL
ncbi:dihydrolipoamide acetyltransferase family protein [Myceligenerans pegani]|uniref:Dihydrolipoamide acetyltransferase component of pyruvate dehydrogenase complex n=1 Tax=Myceligenerans pegani TaxID=2776917 RepID=A0ABR9N2E5_9MICO|nr:dihydrolipoamide acetyltransferase family protein [Myceligenerans sp. TRM 65318]MBE1877401.1 2-oxo acid dehydrogenase subunit E2 [Myceligenerans sp. TRM 65318]MBE3019672.1 2-oxo acid dehydrogenase subunit E2 [Myceligenerans sp. TRM 65318]